MAWFKRKSEKKSLIITVIINVALILVLFFFGLTYFDPPVEEGIAINFGTSNVGAGATQPTEPVKSAPTAEEVTPKETKPTTEETSTKTEETTEKQEDVVTQETEEAPVINKEDKKNKKETEETEKKEPKKKKKEPKKEPEPQPEKSTSDALESVLNGKKNDGKNTSGEGNDNQAGDKGDPSEDPNASSYYGQGTGLDGDGNYRLGGRKALSKKKYTQDCNESGTVVVEIKVNRQGKVVKATPGVKGTTNMSNCLLDPAKRAAMDTKFNSDVKAPSIQTGYIIYEFKLSD